MLLHEMLTGDTPYVERFAPLKLYESILRGARTAPRGVWLSPAATQLINALLRRAPADRMVAVRSGAELVLRRHAFFAQARAPGSSPPTAEPPARELPATARALTAHAPTAHRPPPTAHQPPPTAQCPLQANQWMPKIVDGVIAAASVVVSMTLIHTLDRNLPFKLLDSKMMSSAVVFCTNPKPPSPHAAIACSAISFVAGGVIVTSNANAHPALTLARTLT